ncbi:MAG: hypothetical protein KA004_05180 [Verrucomicrobiales bacterium]|nr:hypothetical protein [Verrucomicrobiales bacterium]
MSDNNQREQRHPEDDIPGSAFAGCLFCAGIMLSLVLWYFVIKFVDHCCRQEAPDFPAPSGEGGEQ